MASSIRPGRAVLTPRPVRPPILTASASPLMLAKTAPYVRRIADLSRDSACYWRTISTCQTP